MLTNGPVLSCLSGDMLVAPLYSNADTWQWHQVTIFWLLATLRSFFEPSREAVNSIGKGLKNIKKRISVSSLWGIGACKRVGSEFVLSIKQGPLWHNHSLIRHLQTIADYQDNCRQLQAIALQAIALKAIALQKGLLLYVQWYDEWLNDHDLSFSQGPW